MRHRDIAALMAGVAPVVKDYVATVAKRLDELAKDFDATVVAFATRLQAVEDRKADKGDPGEPGERGEQGLEGPPGATGPQGEKGDPGEPGIAGLPGGDGPPGERGEKGDDGRDGRDGLPGVQGEKGLDGKDGRDGIDGKDGLGFDDMRVEFDGQRTVTLIFERGELMQRHEIKFAIMLYRGVWRDDVAYEKGDVTTYGGAMWHCNEDAFISERPDRSKNWQLAVKRGRDGKDGKDGQPGERGPTGLPGKDGQWR